MHYTDWACFWCVWVWNELWWWYCYQKWLNSFWFWLCQIIFPPSWTWKDISITCFKSVWSQSIGAVTHSCGENVTNKSCHFQINLQHPPNTWIRMLTQPCHSLLFLTSLASLHKAVQVEKGVHYLIQNIWYGPPLVVVTGIRFCRTTHKYVILHLPGITMQLILRVCKVVKSAM